MGMVLAVFIALSLISTAVYLIGGWIESPTAAFFESVSAFTTTGTSLLEDTSSLPGWLKVFRCACQWIGGGVTLVFLASIVSNTDSSSGGLLRSDSASSALYRTGIRFTSIAKRLLLTYLIMTVVQIIALYLCGFTVLGSLCVSLSTVSTGGFLPAGFIPSGMGETVTVLFMIFTCVNYTLYYHAIKKHFDRFDTNSELYALVFIIAGASILVCANLYFTGTYDLRGSIENGIFNSVSFMTTTGFTSADFSAWPPFAKAILTALSFIGGSSCSLGSGIKLMRIIVVFRIISKSFTSRIHTRAVVTTRINGRRLPSEAASAIGTFFLTYFTFYLAGAFVISFESQDIISCFTVSAALLNNTGAAVESSISYADVSPVMHILMSVLMLAGRLELYTVLLPFSRSDKF